MIKKRLKNGLTVIFDKRDSKSAVMEICVKTGSNNELSNERGASHFLEHLLFEGTKTRTADQIANEIESVGGEFNAATTHERTVFWARVPAKHFVRALDVLADMFLNPLFDENSINKERKVVLDEINLVTDEPRFHQFILLLQTLYKKYPTRLPIYGSKESILAMKKKDIVDYFDKWYVPNNIVVTIVGGVNDPFKKIEDHFGNMKTKHLPKIKFAEEPKLRRNLSVVEHRSIMQSYVVLGFNAASRTHDDSQVFDVIRSVLARGQSGRLFREIRTKRGLGYEVGAVYEAAKGYAYFATYLNTNKSNIELCKKLVLDEIEKLKSISDRDLEEAKTFLEGEFLLANEDNARRADHISSWESVSKAELIDKYLGKIRKVSKSDIKRVVEKYMRNYALAVIEQK